MESTSSSVRAGGWGEWACLTGPASGSNGASGSHRVRRDSGTRSESIASEVAGSGRWWEFCERLDPSVRFMIASVQGLSDA